MFIFASLNEMTLAPFIFWLAWGPLSTAQVTPASLASYHPASHIANSDGAAGGILRLADRKRGKQQRFNDQTEFAGSVALLEVLFH